MTAKLFRTSMAVAVSVMVLSIALFMGMLYQYFSDQMMTELESETWLVSRGVELDGMDYLNGLHTTSRVTWVAADGTVLYDNEADASTMENHADREEIREALEKVDGSSIRLEGRILYFERQDTILDLGALAKGYISDKLKEYLKAAGVESALINLGGNVMTVGSKPDGSPWTVGIQKPFAPRGTYEKTVSVEDRAVISAGTYERYYEWQGQQYHHILDPDTGYPARTEYAQATIISSSGLLGDALSTSCLLLGREGAEALTGQFPDTELIL